MSLTRVGPKLPGQRLRIWCAATVLACLLAGCGRHTETSPSLTATTAPFGSIGIASGQPDRIEANGSFEFIAELTPPGSVIVGEPRVIAASGYTTVKQRLKGHLLEITYRPSPYEGSNASTATLAACWTVRSGTEDSIVMATMYLHGESRGTYALGADNYEGRW